MSVKPASNGHAPGIAIVADHRVPDGPLGGGWRLDGFSRIERRSATNGVPSMDATDVYYVDGMRLYPSGGPGEYRLEKDDNRVFVLTTSSNQWNAYRDGIQWRYGEFGGAGAWRGICATETRLQSADAPCETTGKGLATERFGATTAWNLSWLRDPSANDIFFDYTSNSSLDATGGIFGETTTLAGDYAYQHVPESVRYAGGSHLVQFEYAARPDTRLDARSGRIRLLPARLEAIQVRVGGTAPLDDARYELVYLDQETEDCAGEGLPNLTIDREAASVLHRIARVDRKDNVTRTLRCLETEETRTVVSSTPIDLGIAVDTIDYASDDYRSSTPMVVNFDGDPYPDLLTIRYRCSGGLDDMVCPHWDTSSMTPLCYSATSTCAVSHALFENADDGTGALLPAAALPAAAEAALDEIEDVFEPGTGGWAILDINRDDLRDRHRGTNQPACLCFTMRRQ